MSEQHSVKPLKILIPYELEKHSLKKNDAHAIGKLLAGMGHNVTVVDAAKVEIVNTPEGECIKHDGVLTPLKSYDGATMRVGPEIPACHTIGEALKRNGVAMYQDLPMLCAGCNKLETHEIFNQHNIAEPRTYGVKFGQTEDPDGLDKFLNQIDPGPYVVKKAHGWNGDQVKIIDSRSLAIAQFRDWQKDKPTDGKGGILIQEFIESNRVRRRDYRIHTIVGLDKHGNLEAKIVAASTRVAKPGDRITNVAKGAEKVRVSLDLAEARAHYVEKGGMQVAEFEQKIQSGEIEILTPELIKFSKEMAVAFGPGSLGLDIIVGEKDKKPRGLEVNPFAGGSGKFETQYGFTLYKPWAEAFAGFVAHAKGLDVTVGEGASRVPSNLVTEASGDPALQQTHIKL